MLQDNIKFLQIELKTKNEIIKNLLDTQSAIVESLSLAKQQSSQAASLAKQQTKTQDKPELHRTELEQPTRESFQQHQQNKHHQKKLHDVDQHIQKQKCQSSQQLKQNCKKLYVGNLNQNVFEENINELFGLKSTKHLRQNCSVEMPIDRNTGKSKGFSFLKAPPHVSDELVKLNGFEFQKQSIRIENARTSRLMRHHNRFNINQQNARPNSCINRDSSNQHVFKSKVIPGEKTFAEIMSSSMTSSNPTFNESTLPTSNVVIFGDSLVNFNRKTKYNINSSLNSGRERLLKICYTTWMQLYRIICLKWQ